MITPELIARINALAKKKRSEGLEPHELLEQKKLYRIYLDAIRGQVKQTLDRVEIVDLPLNRTDTQEKAQYLH